MEPVAEAPAVGTPIALSPGHAALQPTPTRLPAPRLAPRLGTKRWRPSIRLASFVLCVVVPVLLAAAYYGFIAADQYVAEFRFGLHMAGQPRAAPWGGLPAGFAAGGTRFDSYAVAQYIGSRAIIDDLRRHLDLGAMFSRREADWPARLHPPVSIERLVRYWRGQVDAFFDPSDGLISVRVRAFTAQDALTLARAVEAAAERLVNDLSARARQDALADAKAEVAASEARLRTALFRLRDFRDRAGLIDPKRAAEATATLGDRVTGELVRARTELATLRGYLRPDAPSVRLLEARIRALEAQRRALAERITAGRDGAAPALSQTIGSYEQLDSERNFAETAYRHALRALDAARAEADRQQVYLATVVPPGLPEEALYPHRLRAIAIVGVIGFALWAIAALAVQSVRDHL